MKNILLLLIAISFANFTNAQSKEAEKPAITIPQFQGETLVLRTLEAAGFFDPVLTISDGSDVKFTIDLLTLKPRNEGANAKTLATVISQLRKQGYKLISSNGGGGGTTTIVLSFYIFQKDEVK